MKQFHDLTIKEMKAEGWGVHDITPDHLESDNLFVDYHTALRECSLDHEEV